MSGFTLEFNDMKDSGLDMQEESKSHTLTDITNFIAQEAYRFRVLKDYAEDYSRINALYGEISSEMEQFVRVDECYGPDQLLCEITDLIVFGSDESYFNQKIKDWIANDFGFNEEPELAEKTLQTAMSIYNNNKEFQCHIPHRYPPHMLALDFDYMDIMDYIHNEYYYNKIEKNVPLDEDDKDWMFDEEELLEGPKVKEVITSTTAPFTSFRPYIERQLATFSECNKDYDVPQEAFSKTRKMPSFVKNVSDMRHSFIHLEFLQELDSTSICNKLTVEIDTRKAMTNRELKQLLTRIQLYLSNIQYQNKQARMILAQTEAQLVKTYLSPDLETPKLHTLGEVFKVDIPEIKSMANVKNCLSGMLLYKEHWFCRYEKDDKIFYERKKKSDGISLVGRAGSITDSLQENFGEKGFSDSMVEKGEKLFNKIIKRSL